MAYEPIQLSEQQISYFRENGYLLLEKLLPEEVIAHITDRLDPLFATRFETGIYPDEWHGRPSLSVANATRQMCGMWRCDRTVAGLSLSAETARLSALLAGWSGARIATDSSWIKPPDAPEVLFHRNGTYAACIDPPEMMTCWMALSDASAEAGTLEIVPSSHQWIVSDQVRQSLHAPAEDYRQPVWQAAAEAGIASPKIMTVEIPPGACIFMHWNLWHGSGKNRSSDQTRRSFGVNTFRADARFQPPGIGYGYIFNRYRRVGETAMDESYFPILWTRDGYRTPFLAEYCEDALLPSAAPLISGSAI